MFRKKNIEPNLWKGESNMKLLQATRDYRNLYLPSNLPPWAFGLIFPFHKTSFIVDASALNALPLFFLYKDINLELTRFAAMLL
jgi:hypothetical protein